MRFLPGRIGATIFAAFLIVALAAAAVMYRLTIEPARADFIADAIAKKTSQALPGASLAFSGSSLSFDGKRRAFIVDLHNGVFTYDAKKLKADLPHTQITLKLTPDKKGWVLPSVALYDPKITAPADENPVKKDSTAEESGRKAARMFRSAVNKSDALVAFGAICAHDAELRLQATEQEDATRLFPRLCVYREGRFGGTRTLNIAAEALLPENENMKTRLVASFYAEGGGVSGLTLQVDNGAHYMLQGLPWEKYVTGLAPDLQEWTFSGDFQIFIDKEGRFEKISLLASHAKARFSRFFDRDEPATILFSDAEIACVNSCREITVSKGDAVFVEAGIEGQIRAKLRHEAESLYMLRRMPEKLSGEADLEVAGVKADAFYTMLSGLGLDKWRQKIDDYLSEGELTKGVVALRFPDAILKKDGRSQGYRAMLEFTDAMLKAPNYKGKLSNVSGRVEVSPEGVKGRLNTGAYNSVRISDVAFEGGSKKAGMSFSGKITGTATDIFSLAPEKVLSKSAKLSYLAANVGGDVDGRFDFTLPSDKSAKKSVHVSASVANVSLKGLFPQTNVTDGNIDVSVENDKTVVTGRVRAEQFVAAPLQDSFLRAPPQIVEVDGAASVDVSFTRKPDRKGEITVEVSADDAAVSSRALDYQKYPGTPAVFTLSGTTQPGETLLRSMRYVSGKDSFAASGGLLSREETRIKASEYKLNGHDVSGDALYTRAGGLKLNVVGKTVNAVVLYDRKQRDKNGGGTAIDVAFSVDKALWKKGEYVTNATGRIICDANRYCRRVDLSANPSRGGSFTFAMLPTFDQDGARGFSGKATDAGAFLAIFGGAKKIEGGRLILDGKIQGKGETAVTKGVANLYDFRATNLAVLKNLPFWQDGGFSIGRFKMPFTYRQGTLTVSEATTSETTLGVTVDGTVDMTKKKLNLRGVLVPAQGGVNRLVANIPLVGKLVTGGKNEGVIGVNYTLTGDVSDPKFFFNPLSILTPGILRRLLILPDSQ